MNTKAFFSQYNNTTIPKHLTALWSKRNPGKMKWLYILFLFFITMCVQVNSHFHGRPFMFYDHEKFRCSSTSLGCDLGAMEEFDTGNEVNIRRRANRRILNDSGSNDEKVASLISEDSNKSDYATSDPPPATKIPTKKTVQYRIFSRPPVASPPSEHM